jgi:hypothetical protein
MSDNLTRYCAIRDALKRLRATEPKGNLARHLQTTAHLISGIVGSKRCHLPSVASKAPDGRKPESRVMRFRRWLANERIDAGTYYLPYVEALLANLPEGPLVLVMDASSVGRGCQALVISVLYQKRALPLCWSVVRGKNGHLPEQAHLALLRQAAEIVGKERRVIFLGDGEFNGIDLLRLLSGLGWFFVCRTSKNTVCSEAGEWYSLSDFPLQRGDRYELEEVFYTQKGYGPLLLAAVWREEEDGPLCLISNLEFFDEVILWYKRRFQIETFFSDQKSRGFHLAHSHLSDPRRLERLLIATCLAYLWIVCLGAMVVLRGWLPQIHRRDRCDLSLFQIGLLWIEHCLNEGLPIPVLLSIRRLCPDRKSVR